MPHGVNQPRLAVCLEFLAQAPGIDFDDVRFSVEVIAPDLLHDRVASKYPARIAHKQRQ